ncbi:hypothetical protein Scel_18630 [Streptomyces cellostaticus]|nr:hypothetical protein Scel_18630 [Streptomyces cellostaticus]
MVIPGLSLSPMRFQPVGGCGGGAVADGGDGGLADEAGEAADVAGGALVEVGGVAGSGPGVRWLRSRAASMSDEVGEGPAGAVAGEEGP